MGCRGKWRPRRRGPARIFGRAFVFLASAPGELLLGHQEHPSMGLGRRRAPEDFAFFFLESCLSAAHRSGRLDSFGFQPRGVRPIRSTGKPRSPAKSQRRPSGLRFVCSSGHISPPHTNTHTRTHYNIIFYSPNRFTTPFDMPNWKVSFNEIAGRPVL